MAASGWNTTAAPAVSITADGEAMTGVLTKTIVPTPVVRWILHARIRHSSYNDAVFVGEDSIHVKQIVEQGLLKPIATKNDFDARIQAAKVFNICKKGTDDDLLFKLENGTSKGPLGGVPPQCLLLTLDSNELVFLWLASNEDGSPRFIQQTSPLPRIPKLLYQPGEHLAVDPQSRAIAVAAREREVVMYSTKSQERIQQALQAGDPKWCPVSAQRPLQVQGVIQQMDFLIPPNDDRGNDDEDHIILLLIVIDEGKTKAVWIDWYVGSDIHDAQIHAAQPLDLIRTVPSLLIPLRNAEFFLIHGTEIKRWKGILSGPPTGRIFDAAQHEPSYPGASPRRPLWVNWCRPKRGKTAVDYIYLIREDGMSYLLEIGSTIDVSDAGSFECHVGSAFASLGEPHGPDILAVAGDMSSGILRAIGGFFTPGEVPAVSRRRWAEMSDIESIPNWASVTDMIVSKLPGRTQRTRDGVFVTSCRQPYGAITELRYGLEADLSTYFEFDGRSVTNVWALPFTALGHVLILLSSPAGTRLFDISQGDDADGIAELDDTETALDTTNRTLAASVTADGKIVQITEGSLRVTPGSSINFEDCANIQCDAGTSILAAAIDTTRNIAIAAMRSSTADSSYVLRCYRLRTDDPAISGDAQFAETASVNLNSEALCSALFAIEPASTIALVATADGKLTAFVVNTEGSLEYVQAIEIPSSVDGPGMCDGIVVLRSGFAVLIVCGLRDGRLYVVVVNPDGSNTFGDTGVILFSQTTVKLSQPANSQVFAYAMSGLDICFLAWNGVSADSLSIQNIWITDRDRPQIMQGPVIACTHTPPAHLLASPELANSLVMVSSDEVSIAGLDQVPRVVPRQMEVNGTPNRLIYSEKHRCLVCASVRYDSLQPSPSNSHFRTEVKRRIRPLVDFIPSRSSAPSYTYELQSGERIHALLEWSVRLDQNKLYSFILVGGSYARSSGAQRGRLRLLQPQNKSWEVVGVKDTHTERYDAPVYALAVDDENNIVACIGQTVVMLKFDAENRKFVHACPPYKLFSPGIQITVSSSNGGIHVSTMKDGLMSLAMFKDQLVEAGYSMRLATQSTPLQADDLLSHVALSDSNDQTQTVAETGVVLVSTKHGKLLGLRPNAAGHQSNQQSEIVFEAQLPRSLTKLRTCHIGPRWKPAPPNGMGKERVVGCSADGSIIGVTTLEESLWRQLCWLQRLVEWSPQLSPHSHLQPAYRTGDEGYARNVRLMPIGLRAQLREEPIAGADEMAMEEDKVDVRTYEVAMRTNRSRLRDAHIDGDVLGRLLKQDDPEGTLRNILSEVATRDDRAGEWMRTHLQEEMAYVGHAVATLKLVLDDWL